MKDQNSSLVVKNLGRYKYTQISHRSIQLSSIYPSEPKQNKTSNIISKTYRLAVNLLASRQNQEKVKHEEENREEKEQREKKK